MERKNIFNQLVILSYAFFFFNGALMFYPNIKNVVGVVFISFALTILSFWEIRK